jgi:type II secretory pathway component PulM
MRPAILGRWKATSRRERIFLAVGLTFLLLVAAYRGVITPLQADITRLRLALPTLRKTASAVDNNAQEMTLIKESINAQLQYHKPGGGLADALKESALLNGISIKIITGGGEEKAPAPAAKPADNPSGKPQVDPGSGAVEAEGSGPFKGLATFLSDMRRIHGLRVTTLQLAPAGEAGAVSYKITISPR